MITTHDDDDFLSLIGDTADTLLTPASRRWRILVVDDDVHVHEATEFVLGNARILGRGLQFLHAHMAREAETILRHDKDVAVILLDVVMEHPHADHELVRTIRSELGMSEARIILRTGQPGYAPEIDTIRDYDINDDKTKSELSSNALYTTLTAAIRSYEQVHTINATRRGLDMIIGASRRLMARHGTREFAAGIITQIADLLGLEPEGIVCTRDQLHDRLPPVIIAAMGRFTRCIDQLLAEVTEAQVVAARERALRERRCDYDDGASTRFFGAESGHDMALHLATGVPLDGTRRRLLEVFRANITVGLDNVVLFERLKDQLLHVSNRLAFVRAVDAAIAVGRLPPRTRGRRHLRRARCRW